MSIRMELYFKIFLQGSPFVAFVTYLFILKRTTEKPYIQLFLPIVLYFIGIVFCKRIFIDDYEEYNLTYHIWIINALFSGWAFYLFLKKYDDDVLEAKIRKLYKNICKNKDFQYINFDKEKFLEAIRYIKIQINQLIPFENMEYELSYRRDEFYDDKIYMIVSKIFIEKDLLKDVEKFLENKKIPYDRADIFYELYRSVLYYVCKNDLAFYWNTSYKENEIIEKIWIEKFEKTKKY